MSIAGIMSTGLSALTANQQALKTTSTNVANVNTKGYSRLTVNFVSDAAGGGTGGVDVKVDRVANMFLAAAEMRGAADVSSADQLSQFIDRAQSLLGDPSKDGTVFAGLDPIFSDFGSLSVDPSSALRRSTTLSDISTFLNQVQSTSNEFTQLRQEADTRIAADIDEANTLMSGIAKLNVSIQSAHIGGTNSSEAETQQQSMLDRLSEIMDIRVQSRSLGGVDVRTTDGFLLVDAEAGKLSATAKTADEPFTGISATPPRGTSPLPLDVHLQGGELKGLLRARDKELPDLQLAFGEFAAGAADALNAAHNQTTSFPAPTSLSGRNTGLIAGDALNFTGSTNVAIVASDGTLQRNLRIDFGAKTITDETGATQSFAGGTVGDLATALNASLGASGAASFQNGALSVSATGTNGVAVTDDPTSPARRVGQGFSQFFGLNDLVRKATPITYSTGLTTADAHGFTTGDKVTFALRNADGAITGTVDFTVGSGTTIASLRDDITAALGSHGSASFDNTTGRLQLNSSNSGGSIDIIRDGTTRGDTGLSMSSLFGLGQAIPSDRAGGLAVRSDIAVNPALLGAATANLAGATTGTKVISTGDGSGALILEAAGTTNRNFATAGSLASQSTSINDYAARLAGHAGGRASALDSAKTAADAVRTEVQQRRSSEEGVNLDEELVNMTTYQQAYNAASRLITAARDMYDTLINMIH